MNAAHAMPENGELIVRCFLKKAEEVIIVEVEDTGTGISEENLKRIFDPFFTTKGPDKGTGLGLSVSQNIINLHKGQMEISSQLGEGTKVSVTLRISKQEG